MSFLRKLDRNLSTAIIVFVASLICFGATGFLINSEYIHIPLGFIFSGGVTSLLYCLTYFLCRLDEKKHTNSWSIAANGIRMIVIVATMILIGLMSYRWNIKLFNIFVFVGVYTFGVVVFVLLHLLANRKEKDESK